MSTMPQARLESRKLDLKYEKVERIGEGSYGVVFKAKRKFPPGSRDSPLNPADEKYFAIKKIRFDNSEEGVPATALREIAVLKEIRCKNVVTLEEVVHERDDKNKLYLVFEYMNVDLKVYIDSLGPEGMDFRIFKTFARQMLNGLAECHSKLIIHRDLKPQNILIDSEGNLKLADFGLARTYKAPVHKFTHEVVTLWYRAPEILLGRDHYSTGVDMWAAGCIIAEMYNLSALFPGDSEIDQIFRVFRLLGTPDPKSHLGQCPDYCLNFPKFPPRRFSSVLPDLSTEGLDLIQNLITLEPSKRLTAREAIEHSFFKTPIQQDED